MRWRRVLTVVMVCVTWIGLTPNAFGGEQADPDIGDTLLGKAGGIRYASESTDFNPLNNRYGHVDVGCGGPDWHLIGGGWRGEGAASETWHSSGRPLDYRDEDLAGDDGWYASGYGPAAGTYTGFSMCIQNSALRYRQRDVADQPSGVREGSIGCGADPWEATSGSPFIATSESWAGSSFPQDGDDGDHRPDDGWRGTAWDTVGGIGGFYVFVVCTRGHDLRYVKGTPVTISAGQTANLRAACRHDEHVVGGGARLTGTADEGRLVSSYPSDGHDDDTVPDDGWQVRAHNVAGNDKKVTPFAICLS